MNVPLTFYETVLSAVIKSKNDIRCYSKRPSSDCRTPARTHLGPPLSNETLKSPKQDQFQPHSCFNWKIWTASNCVFEILRSPSHQWGWKRGDIGGTYWGRAPLNAWSHWVAFPFILLMGHWPWHYVQPDGRGERGPVAGVSRQPSAGWARPKLSVYVTADSFAVKSAHCEPSPQDAEKEPQLERNAVASVWGFNSRILAIK